MNNRWFFLAGTIAGLASVMAFAALFSTPQDAASAQMMQHQGMNAGAMGPNMMASSSAGQSYSRMFSGSGSSAVSNVKVTGVSITGDSEVTVSLRYTGAGESPSLVVIANTNPAAMMTVMHGPAASSGSMGMGGMQGAGMMGQGGMMSGMSMMSGSSGYPAWTSAQWQQWHTQMAHQLSMTNSTQWEQWHTQMMMSPVWSGSTVMPHVDSLQVGSSAVDAGWKNGSFKVKLEGDGSAYDSGQVMVMVFPLTS